MQTHPIPGPISLLTSKFTQNFTQNSRLSKPENYYIKNPYLQQYKNFEERLKNPKIKPRSLVMRKKVQITDKQNLEKQKKQAYKEQCFREARKMLGKQSDFINIFPVHRTIDYQIQSNNKQSQIMLQLKNKIQSLKNIDTNSTLERPYKASFKIRPRLNTTQTAQDSRQILSERSSMTQKMTIKTETNSLRADQSRTRNKRLPLSFIGYKKDKNLAKKFTMEKLSKRLR